MTNPNNHLARTDCYDGTCDCPEHDYQENHLQDLECTQCGHMPHQDDAVAIRFWKAYDLLTQHCDVRLVMSYRAGFHLDAQDGDGTTVSLQCFQLGQLPALVEQANRTFALVDSHE